jgi:hypothetical protein
MWILKEYSTTLKESVLILGEPKLTFRVSKRDGKISANCLITGDIPEIPDLF